ncbi:MAG: hypothetical protein KDB22_29735, partial [Planctomycetales bacterium]|nr:hypothetical protein [Planctomycetales bacterium]
MPAAGARTSLSQSRAALIAAAIIYAVLLWALHATYLNDVWDYYGFIYEPLSLARAATGFVLVASIAAFMPLQWTRPSALVVNLLFGIVYVPTVVITLGLSAASLERYGLELVALALGMGFISFASRLGRSSASNRTVRIAPLLLFWGVGCVWLVIQYSSTMRFVGLDQMYAQRELGASTSLASGYLQTYFANVLSPALFALGLLRKNRFLLLMGLAGCLLIYMINAQKTVLLLPPAMVALHLAMRWRGAIWSSSFVILAALSAFASTALGLHLVGLRSYLLQDFLIFRMLAIPGLTFSQYSDVFQKWGYTWWSNVRGLDLLVEPPPNL